MSAADEERRAYFFRSYLSHLFEGEDLAELYRTLEETAFLARQADYLGGFRATGDDLEGCALPAALGEGDWHRFLRYAVVAFNLRGMAESLADERILAALVRAGRRELALDVVSGLNDPLRGAASKSAVAAALGAASPHFEALREEQLRDLSSASPPEDAGSATAWAEALESVVRALGSRVGPRWADWVRRLEAWPESAARVRRAVAESYLGEGRLESPELFRVLAEIGDRARLGSFLPGCLEAPELPAVGSFLEDLRDLGICAGPEGQELLWQCRFVLLGRQALASPELALATWRRFREDPPPPWSTALAEAADRFLGSLSFPELEALAPDDPTLGAAVSVVALEARPSEDRRRGAEAALTRVPAENRLHWSLRYLATRPRGATVRRQVGAVLAYLLGRGFAAPPEDLARFLDLVARHRPAELAREVDRVAAAPAMTPKKLLVLAERVREEEVLHLLFRRAEDHAAAVSPDEATGFELRGALVVRIARRLVLFRGVGVLDEVAERLLESEEDELRAAVAPELAAAGRKEAAVEVCQGIAAPRLRLLTRLELEPDPGTLADLLRADSLYSALADVERFRDEQLAVAAEPSAVFEIRGEETRTRALLRLAEERLHVEITRRSRRSDRSAALEKVRHAMSFADVGQLAMMTPALAELGARRGRGWAVAEFQEAVRCLMELREVPWTERRLALEELLVRIGSVLPAAPSAARDRRRAVAVLEAFFRLPARPPDHRHWWESLPLVLAALDRFGGAAQRDRLLRRVRASRPALGADEEPLAAACLADPASYPRLTRDLMARDRPAPALLEALAYLLAERQPEEVPALVARHPDRDALVLRLVRHRWLPVAWEAELCDLAAAPAARLEARLWHRLRCPAADPSSWLATLGELAAHHGLDLAWPQNGPLLSHLRTLDSATGRGVLARAVLDALRLGVPGRAEETLRLWLHTRPVTRGPAAFDQAKRLSPEPATPEEDETP